MEGKDSLVFYKSFYETIQKLEEKDQIKLFKAICELGFFGKEPQLEGIVDIVFTAIKPQVIANNKKYENGKKGGRPKAETTDLENKNHTFENKKPEVLEKENHRLKNEKPNVNVNENVNVNVNENENDIYSPSGDEQDTPLKELSDNFDKLWDIYPRKEGKNTAFNHYKTWINGKKYSGKTKQLTNRQMWYAIQIYNYDIFKDKTKKSFIKMGSTFFNEAIYEYASRYIENIDYWEKEIARWQRNE